MRLRILAAPLWGMGRFYRTILHGVDILEERIQAARDHSLPGIDLRCGKAVDLDFTDASFDMISMFLVL